MFRYVKRKMFLNYRNVCKSLNLLCRTNKTKVNENKSPSNSK